MASWFKFINWRETRTIDATWSWGWTAGVIEVAKYHAAASKRRAKDRSQNTEFLAAGMRRWESTQLVAWVQTRRRKGEGIGRVQLWNSWAEEVINWIKFSLSSTLIWVSFTFIKEYRFNLAINLTTTQIRYSITISTNQDGILRLRKECEPMPE